MIDTDRQAKYVVAGYLFTQNRQKTGESPPLFLDEKPGHWQMSGTHAFQKHRYLCMANMWLTSRLKPSHLLLLLIFTFKKKMLMMTGEIFQCQKICYRLLSVVIFIIRLLASLKWNFKKGRNRSTYFLILSWAYFWLGCTSDLLLPVLSFLSLFAASSLIFKKAMLQKEITK